MVATWCQVKICGVRDYTVQVCTKVPNGNSGECVFLKGLIKVRIAELTHMEDTVFQELTHGVWDASGLRDMLRRRTFGGRTLTEAELIELEEDILVIQTPGLLATLKGAGWLTIPAPPETK